MIIKNRIFRKYGKYAKDNIRIIHKSNKILLHESQESYKTINSFSDSPLRFEMEVMMEEYRRIVDEINLHLSNENKITNMNVIFIVGVFAIFQFLPDFKTYIQSSSVLASLILLVLFLLLSFAFLYLGEDLFISFLGSYIGKVLRPKMENLIYKATGEKQNILEWGEYFSKYGFKSIFSIPKTIVSIYKFTLAILPTIIVFLYYLNIKMEGIEISFLENSLLVFFIVSFLLFIICSIITIISFYSNAFYKRKNQ